MRRACTCCDGEGFDFDLGDVCGTCDGSGTEADRTRRTAKSGPVSAAVLANNAETVTTTIGDIIRAPQFALGFFEGRLRRWRDVWAWSEDLREAGAAPDYPDGRFNPWGYDRGQLAAVACPEIEPEDFVTAAQAGWRGPVAERIKWAVQDAFYRREIL